MIFIQLYVNFARFECKLFLTDALQYFGGSCKTCMIDNTHVVVLRGTGAEMVPVPEMAAFAERYGFVFRAHEKGDANRSARVERPFDYVDKNFLAGRQFADLRDANQQAVAWCDKVNGSFKRHLHCSPRELFAVEQPLLRPLPVWVPEVYLLHHRIVDMEGYVNVRSNRYSAPYELMGRRVEIRESKERIEVYLGPRKVAEHSRCLDANGLRVCLPEHLWVAKTPFRLKSLTLRPSVSSPGHHARRTFCSPPKLPDSSARQSKTGARKPCPPPSAHGRTETGETHPTFER
jgi:hypothetical protein